MIWWRRPLTVVLVVLLGLVQLQLWAGKGGVTRVLQLRSKVATVTQHNESAKQTNAQIQAEVSDLKEGLEMVEEKARSELGMVRNNEILVQYDAHALTSAPTVEGHDGVHASASMPASGGTP